jgi:hypothetical protein
MVKRMNKHMHEQLSDWSYEWIHILLVFINYCMHVWCQLVN